MIGASAFPDIPLASPYVVYMTPHRLFDAEQMPTETFHCVVQSKPALLVIDEAHQVARCDTAFAPQWTHLGALRKALNGGPCLCATATATYYDLEATITSVGLVDPQVLRTPLERDNIHMQFGASVRDVATNAHTIFNLIQGKKALVYVGSVKKSGPYHDALTILGV